MRLSYEKKKNIITEENEAQLKHVRETEERYYERQVERAKQIEAASVQRAKDEEATKKQAIAEVLAAQQLRLAQEQALDDARQAELRKNRDLANQRQADLTDRKHSTEFAIEQDTGDISAIITNTLTRLYATSNVSAPIGSALRPTELLTQLDDIAATANTSPTVQGQRLAQSPLNNRRAVVDMAKSAKGGDVALNLTFGMASNAACRTLLDICKVGLFEKCSDRLLICIDGNEAASRGELVDLGFMDAIFALDSSRPQDDPTIHPVKRVTAGSIS